MTADEIKKGESEILEFKGNELSEDPKKWLKTAIAFANGKGGSIVFRRRRLYAQNYRYSVGKRIQVHGLDYKRD